MDKGASKPGKPSSSSKENKKAESLLVKKGSETPSVSDTSANSLAEVLKVTQSLQEMLAQQNVNMSKLARRMDEYDQCEDNEEGYDNDYYEGDYEDYDSFGVPPVLHPQRYEPSAKRMKVPSATVSVNPDKEVSAEIEGDARFLGSLDKYKIGEKNTTKVDAGLANTINAVFNQGLSQENFSVLKKDILRPENCTGLARVKVNSVFWDAIPKYQQDLDGRFQVVQEAICKGSILLTELIQEGSLSKTLNDEAVAKGVDALACFGHANTNLNYRRRELLRPHIHADFRHLCSSTVPFTTQLFGDDISKTVKEIQEINRVSGKTSHGRGRGRGGRGNYRGSNRGGRGRGNYNQGGYVGWKNQKNQSQAPNYQKKKA